MFRWMWRSKLGPIRLLVLMFGHDLADINIEKEATYRMIVLPKAGAEHSKLYKTCKKIFQVDNETAADKIDLWTKAKNRQIPVHPMEVTEMFALDNLSPKDVNEIREICKKDKVFMIEYDEMAEIESRANWEAKQKVLKQRTDHILRDMSDSVEASFDEVG